MKHLIFTRMKFQDRSQLELYLPITKKFLLPQLKKQTNKNFIWGLLIYERDIEFVREYLDIDFEFTTFSNKAEYVSYVKENHIEIQTRHDMDDYMSITYIQKLQELYKQNIKTHKRFLIQSQPIKYDCKKDLDIKMGLYHNKRTSMMLTLCQKDIDFTIIDRPHGQMWQIDRKMKVISLPEGYTKWVIHGNNISYRGKKNKK